MAAGKNFSGLPAFTELQWGNFHETTGAQGPIPSRKIAPEHFTQYGKRIHHPKAISSSLMVGKEMLSFRDQTPEGVSSAGFGSTEKACEAAKPVVRMLGLRR
jgi:hypothetical protein